MAFGDRICAACGSKVGVQEHHLVARVFGGLPLPTVWLCFLCHGLVHDVPRPAKHSELTAAGIAAGRLRRSKPVEPPPAYVETARSLLPALKVRRAKSDAFAATVWPAIKRARACGAESLREIAAVLEAAGVLTMQGKARWDPGQVKRVIDAVEGPPKPPPAVAQAKAKISAARLRHDRLVAALDAAWLAGYRGAARVAAYLNNEGVPCKKVGQVWTATRVKNLPEYRFQVVSHLETSVSD